MRWMILGFLAAAASLACVIDEHDSSGGTSGACEVGHEGCPCTSGGSCNPGFTCDNNLNICLLPTCPIGTETCPCTSGSTCDPGLQCASHVCVDASCPPGTEGCPCTQNGGCDPDLACLSDTCVDDSTLDGSSGDPCGPANCTVWACGEREPACPCECAPGCERNVATNCGEPAPCVERIDCDDARGSCEPLDDDQFGCAAADTGTG